MPDDWKPIAWERFDYVECAIFQKPTDQLTAEDRANWVDHFSERPEGWLEPTPSSSDAT